METANASARLAAVNQESPFGSVRYDVIGNQNIGGNNVPQYQQTVSLSPEQRQLYDKTTSIENQALDTGMQAVGNVQNTIGQPFSLQGLPPLRTGATAAPLQSGYQNVGPSFGFDRGGPVQSGLTPTGQRQDFATPGGLQSSVPITGQQNSVATTGQQTSVPAAGQIQAGISPSGQVQSGISPAGQVQAGLNPQGLPGLPGANDFSAERQRVEDAYLSRFNTDVSRQEADIGSRLNAQGLQQGSEAWDREMQRLDRQRVDARNAAIQAGGAEQSRLFNQAAQARGQLFGEDVTKGQFANQAQGQLFGQNLAGGQFANQAQNQLFGQNLAGGQFTNEALQNQFGQNVTAGQFANQAQNDLFAQYLGAGQFGNQAQQQGYNQNLGAAAFENQARQGIFDQLQSAMGANNAAQAQQFGQSNALADFYNQAAGQATSQNQANAAFYNAAQQQDFGQNLQNASMGNQARQQAINEQQIARNQSLNELASLLGMSQIQTPTGAPNFGVNVNPTDVLGAYAMQQQGLQNNYNQQMQAKSSMWNALGGLGGMLGAAKIMRP